MSEVTVRAGGPADRDAILAIWDEAVAWLVARGQVGQWGTTPASERPDRVERVERDVAGPGLRIAEIDGEPCGVLVVGSHPSYVEPIERPELYVQLLLSSRRFAGRGIGAMLIAAAADEARAAGAEILRVDCWADAPGLVGFYEAQGFVRSATFTVVGDWHGQVFEMSL